jgi:RNA polymerase sigma-70 factor (ECF subfamily)
LCVRNRARPAIRVVVDRDLGDTNDRDRLEAIFREHYEAVLAYARRRAPISVADDAVAETFTIAWRKADKIPREPLPWLLGIARRVLATQRRASERRERLSNRLARNLVATSPDDQLGEALVAALNALPDRDREVLLLIAWEGLTAREAAAVVGVSPAAVYVRLHRARRRLRAALVPPKAPDSSSRSVRSDLAPVGKGESR